MKTRNTVLIAMAIGSLNYFSLFCQSFTGRTHLPTHAKATTSTEQRRRGRILFLSLSSNDRAFQDWSQDSRIDVRNFLTQRSIQSFIFLCEECRDPHSGKWIEDFLGTKNLLAYHGTGASFVTGFSWDVPLLEILDQPKDVMIVSAKRRGRGHGGWSKNNPYLKDRYVEFKITIDPISLTDRILAVREQLASEWAIDLEILGRANQQILDSYFQLAKNDRQIQNQDFATAPTIAFERTAVNAINNQTAFGATGSPFRKGSFDLLYNLCTQASIHRLLYLLREQGDYSNLEWIHDFYLDRLVDYFDGDLPYGRADDFVEELLLSSPSIIDGGDGKVSLTDPFGLSEKIIEIRNDIFSEWIIAMNQVPIAHQSGVRKNLLSKQIGADSTPRSNPQDDSSNSGDFQ